ncbi:adenylate/guanylate cyclase domain-containing protein [Alphaproteobacteria bacterium]|nr:adenylate/guanylate cyclase domain-containing protein [Alphaproteobacteria bacterium]
MSFFNGRKLKLDIFVAFAALITITVACEIWYSSNVTKDLRLSFEKNYYSKLVTKTTINWIDEYFNKLEIMINIIAKNFKNYTMKSFNNYRKLFLETLKDVSNISSIYMGFNDGTLFQVRRLYGIKNFQTRSKGVLPDYAKFAIRTIEHDDKIKELGETWTYLNDDFNTIASEKLGKSKYNITKSDWYVKTELRKDKYWSEIYIFSASQKPGLTLSMPLGYELDTAVGIISIDFEIKQFRNLLREIKGSENSKSYIMNQKNEIIVSSVGIEKSASANSESQKVTLVSAIGSEDKVLEKAILAVLSSESQHVYFSVDGEKYIASMEKLKKIPCNLLVIAPQRDFTGDLKAVQRQMMLLSSLVYIVAFIVVWLLSKKISKPIAELCQSAIAIGKMDLDNYHTPPKSNIFEIKELSNAMNSMKLSVSTFSKYAPKDLVIKLLKSGVTPVLGGKTANVTMLFSDIEQFSGVSERLPAEYLMLHLSEYFDELTREIMKNNGVIDKYIGDSIMAIWGAPNPDENQVVNACYAALKCQKLLRELEKKWRHLRKPFLPTRIGLHTGIAIVGNIGSRDRMNFTAMGDTVDIASRLEGVNKYYGTKILASENIENAAKNKILFRVIDKIAVKGKTVGLTIYEPIYAMNKPDDKTYYKKIELCEKSQDAFELYQNERFSEAFSHYSKLLESFPDIASSIKPIMKRCKKFAEFPTKNWDGTFHLMDK